MGVSWCLSGELGSVPVQESYIPSRLVIFKDFLTESTKFATERNLFCVETPVILLVRTHRYLFRLIVLCWWHI